MSWIEDEGLLLIYTDKDRENDWQNGYHRTKSGKRMLISNMKTSHLKHTINFFKRLDTTPLEEVYYRRDLRKE